MDFIEAFSQATFVLENMDEQEHEELLEWIEQIRVNFEESFGETSAVVAEYSVPANLAALAFAAGWSYGTAPREDEIVMEVPMTRTGLAEYIAYLQEGRDA
jgi:hypothetical protein